MAAVGEDDEAWLYGEGEKKDATAVAAQGVDEGDVNIEAATEPEAVDAGDAVTNGAEEEDKEAGEVQSGEDGEKEEEDDNDDDDDSDDDVQVTIGDIKAQTSYEATPKFKSAYQRAPITLPSKSAPTKGLDVDASGAINGVPIYDFDLNSLPSEEKPWHKPGADITDYFNYGFTEETWMKYCAKQRQMRVESQPGAKSYSHGHNQSSHGITPKNDRSLTDPNSNVAQVVPSPGGTTPASITSAASGVSPAYNRKAGPPPGRKMSGAIDVIGGVTSRRPQARNEYPDFMPSSDHDTSKKYVNPMGPPVAGILPPTHIPPPDFSSPPPGMPPTNVPPPHMGVPPPGMPPPGFPARDPFPDAFYPPPGGPPDTSAPPPGYGRGSYGYTQYGAPPPGYGGPPPTGGPGWDNRPPGSYQQGWGYGAVSPRSDSDFSSSEEERDRRFRSHDRGRDMYDPFESRDSSYNSRRERDRSRSKDRAGDRERRHRERDREERHKSRRKHDDDSSRSKHKKSKKSKRERNEESMETGGGSQEEVAS